MSPRVLRASVRATRSDPRLKPLPPPPPPPLFTPKPAAPITPSRPPNTIELPRYPSSSPEPTPSRRPPKPSYKRLPAAERPHCCLWTQDRVTHYLEITGNPPYFETLYRFYSYLTCQSLIFRISSFTWQIPSLLHSKEDVIQILKSPVQSQTGGSDTFSNRFFILVADRKKGDGQFVEMVIREQDLMHCQFEMFTNLTGDCKVKGHDDVRTEIRFWVHREKMIKMGLLPWSTLEQCREDGKLKRRWEVPELNVSAELRAMMFPEENWGMLRSKAAEKKCGKGS